ncbi:MAG: ABC transporter ATP-binding protein [Eubacteriales bacterium]|nr:ABC transporter ATP-binding protein [Eubacteriales bacterium]
MELKTRALSKRYGSTVAVNKLDLSLSNGVYGLLGANGAGKTTLMRLLCGIQRPSSGLITLDGKEISKLGESYRDLLGYLPQHFSYYPDFTARNFLLYVGALKGLTKAEAKRRSAKLLKAVGLLEEQDHKIKSFSGGMKQRLGIAQAMLNNPYILILDEPTAGLDPKERVRFRNLISAFSKDRVVILSTHIVSDVEFIAEKIILLKKGRIIHFGSPREITAEIDGLVWECQVPSEQVERYKEIFNISNLRNLENSQTVLRIISKKQPLDNAVPVQARLEDLYLYCFEEVNDYA